MRHLPCIAALFATLMTAAPAFADTATPDAHLRRSTSAAGYAYEFQDDLVHTLGNSAGALVIRGHGRGTRAGLIRPRVQFVPELLKSVEAL